MPNRIQEAEDALCGSMEMQAFMALIRRTPRTARGASAIHPAVCHL